MEQPEKRALSELVARQIDPDDAQELVQKAINEGLSGRELQISLVISGAAMGVDRVQQYAITILHNQIGLLKKALADIDAKAQDAAGNDEMIAFVQGLRAPLTERIREHIATVEGSYAQSAEQQYGIDQKLFLSELPCAAMDADAMIAAGAAAAFMHTPPFHGFILTKDVAGMKCPCLYHLALEVPKYKTADSAEAIMRIAIERFGTLDSAMAQFGAFIIDKVRKEMKEFEKEFGNVDPTGSTDDTSAAHAVLSRFFIASGGKHGHDAE